LTRIEHTWRSYMKICPDHDWPPASAIARKATWGPMIDAARHLRDTGEILPPDQVKKTGLDLTLPPPFCE
jgi:hypothetical protein